MLVSFTGSGLTRFGVSVWVFQETRDPQAFAALLFFAVIPLAIGSLVAGPLIDRFDLRSVLILANVVASVPTLAVMALLATGTLALPHLYVALFVNGFANAFVLPGFDASIRSLVPPRRLAHASGYAQMIQTLGLIVAPPIAGVLLAAFGLFGVFLLDVASVTVAVAALLLVRIPRRPRATGEARTGVARDFVLGVRYVGARPALVLLLGVLGAAVLASSFTYALSGPLVLAFGDERTIGIVYAAFGIGSVLGAFVVGVTGGTRPRMRGVAAAIATMGGGAVITSLRPDLLPIAAGVLVLGSAQAVLLTLDRTIYMEHVASEMLGRVFALRLVCISTAQATGLPLAGWLAATVFEPGMMPGGSLAGTFAMLETGPGRGSAVMILATGAFLVGLGLLVAALPALRAIESRLGRGRRPAT